jgi:hypothetical protein
MESDRSIKLESKPRKSGRSGKSGWASWRANAANQPQQRSAEVSTQTSPVLPVLASVVPALVPVATSTLLPGPASVVPVFVPALAVPAGTTDWVTRVPPRPKSFLPLPSDREPILPVKRPRFT